MILSELVEDGKITPAQAKKLKAKYTALHATVVKTYKATQELHKSVKEKNSQLLAEKIKLERQKISQVEEKANADKLRRARDMTKLRRHDEAEKLTNLLALKQEKLQDRKMNEKHVDRLKLENEKLLRPQIEAVNEDIKKLQVELNEKNVKIEKENQKHKDLRQNTTTMRYEVKELALDEVRVSKENAKLRGDPARIRKQGDIVDNAVAKLRNRSEIQQKELGPTGPTTVALEEEKQRHHQLDEAEQDVLYEIDQHKAGINQRHRELELLRKQIDTAQLVQQQHHQKRVQLGMRGRELNSNSKTRLEMVSHSNKNYEYSVRKLKRAGAKSETVKSSLPNLEMQITDLQHSLENEHMQTQKAKEGLALLKQEVQMMEKAFLRKQQRNEVKSQKLQTVKMERVGLESEFEQWRVEQADMAKSAAMLSAQREMTARQCTKGKASLRQAQHEAKIKQLLIGELRKKCENTEAQFKEFRLLYDIVKNERNRYVGLIQNSTQAHAEMREKIKILENEVKILRNESRTKAEAVTKMMIKTAQAINVRDQLRLRSNVTHIEFRERQSTVEQQVLQVDKLNQIINNVEDHMLRVKVQYEQAVENRNFMGLQLIERNDELCILFERANMQEKTNANGIMCLTAKKDEIRMLKLQLKECQRQIEVTKKLIPEVPRRQERVRELQSQLTEQRQNGEKLSRDLETPENGERWMQLIGEDEDMDQLKARAADLDTRIAQKKDKLIEKELVLEEITSLSDKLRGHASKGREGMLKLARGVNDFQAKIRETTQHMMASVSELSMYHATAMKLEEEARIRNDELLDAQWRVERNEAPSEALQHECLRMVQTEMRQREMAEMRGANSDVAPSMITATTAEPRPNAYIPADSIGLPIPYGQFAPMKPSMKGSTMRHIRKQKQIQMEL